MEEVERKIDICKGSFWGPGIEREVWEIGRPERNWSGWGAGRERMEGMWEAVIVVGKLEVRKTTASSGS